VGCQGLIGTWPHAKVPFLPLVASPLHLQQPDATCEGARAAVCGQHSVRELRNVMQGAYCDLDCTRSCHSFHWALFSTASYASTPLSSLRVANSSALIPRICSACSLAQKVSVIVLSKLACDYFQQTSYAFYVPLEGCQLISDHPQDLLCRCTETVRHDQCLNGARQEPADVMHTTRDLQGSRNLDMLPNPPLPC